MGKVLTAILAMVASTGFTYIPVTANLWWLAGHWVQEGADGWAQETWTAPRGGVMLGTGLTGKGSAAKSFEFMRIADGSASGVVFWGSPGGQTPVAFPLAKYGRQEVAFENPKHDYPTRISYRRQGRTLIATTSGPGGSNPQTWRYTKMDR